MAPKNQNRKALCLLTSWFESIGVQYEQPVLPGTEVRVSKREGGYLDVAFGKETDQTETTIVAVLPPVEETQKIAALVEAEPFYQVDEDEVTQIVSVLPPRIETERLTVLASDITHRDREIGMGAIRKVIAAAGYGHRKLMDRGAGPVLPEGRKRLYGEDLDLSVMRHQQFRQVPNPPAYVYQELGNVIKTCAKFFQINNQELCRRLGFSLNELKSYAMVWTATFWGTSRIVWPKGDDNQRLLYSYLRQRFTELYQQMRSARMRNTIPDQSSIDAGFDLDYAFDVTNESRADATPIAVSRPVLNDEQLAEMDVYRAAHTTINTETEKKRRKSAAELLNSKLAAMDHDTMIAALESAATSLLTCPDTRKEARRHIKLHQARCTTCNPPVEVSAVTVIHGYTLRIDEAANETTIHTGRKTA
jgi:hypothetical protein